MTMKRLAVALFFLGALAVVAPALAGACPLCREALIDPAHPQAVTRAAKGYAVSIAALVGMPFVLVGGVATLIVRASRRRGADPR